MHYEFVVTATFKERPTSKQEAKLLKKTKSKLGELVDWIERRIEKMKLKATLDKLEFNSCTYMYEEDAEIDQLVQIMDDAGMDPCAMVARLGETVHDTASLIGSTVNNEGEESQLRFLLGELGHGETLAIVERIAQEFKLGFAWYGNEQEMEAVDRLSEAIARVDRHADSIQQILTLALPDEEDPAQPPPLFQLQAATKHHIDCCWFHVFDDKDFASIEPPTMQVKMAAQALRWNIEQRGLWGAIGLPRNQHFAWGGGAFPEEEYCLAVFNPEKLDGEEAT